MLYIVEYVNNAHLSFYANKSSYDPYHSWFLYLGQGVEGVLETPARPGENKGEQIVHYMF